MKKKIFISFVVLISFIGLLSAPVYASSGWDEKSTFKEYWYDGSETYGPEFSTGGDLKVCFNDGNDNITLSVDLIEFDPNNANETVSSNRTVDGDGCLIYRGIGEYVEGLYAEFQVHVTSSQGSDILHATFYD